MLQNVLHANALCTYEIVFMPFLSFNNVRIFSLNSFVCSGSDTSNIYIRGFQYSLHFRYVLCKILQLSLFNSNRGIKFLFSLFSNQEKFYLLVQSWQSILREILYDFSHNINRPGAPISTYL